MAFRVISCDGSSRLVQPAGKQTLDDLRSAIGNWIQLIRTNNKHNIVVFVDEEGILRRKPPNPVASAVARELGWEGFVLRGPVVFTNGNEGEPLTAAQDRVLVDAVAAASEAGKGQ